MIIDRLEYSECYENLLPGLKTAFDYLKNTDFKTVEPGRHEIDGDKVYAVVSTYDTVKPSEKKSEAHRKYLDIQYLVSGEECLGYEPVEGLKIAQEYNTENDFLLVENSRETMLPLGNRIFIVLFPQDAHKPGCVIHAAQTVVKVVVKVAIED